MSPVLADLGFRRHNVHAASGGAGGVGLRLPGSAGVYVSTPDSVLNSVTGDIDIRWYGKAVTWGGSVDKTLLAKLNTTGNQRSYRLYIDATNQLVCSISLDGITSYPTVTSAGAVAGLVDGQAAWLRATVKMDNGAGNHVGTLYTSADGITWTQVATSIGGGFTGVASIFDSTAAVELGAISGGTASLFNGTVFYAEVRNGIDGPVVARFDSSRVQASGAATPATINGWTWNGAALYKRDDYIRLPGVAGNFLSRAKVAAEQVTSDIDIRIKCSLDDVTARHSFVVKQQTTVQRQFDFEIGNGTAKRHWFSVSNDGTTINSTGSSADVPFVNGQVGWHRVTWRQSDGRVQFSTSLDGTTWVPSGADTFVQAGVAMFDSSSYYEVGSRIAGTNALLSGNVYAVEVRAGIDGPVVAAFNAADNADVTPWTINGSGWNWEGTSFAGKPVIALSLPGVASNYVSTPDTAGNSILGDIDLRMKVALPDWTPSSTMTFIGKNVGDPNRAFRWTLLTPGTSQLEWWPTGSNASIITKISTVAIPFADGATGWVRVTLDVDNGASGNTVSFYTSIDGVVWTPLGAPVITAGVTTMVDTAAAIEVGANFNGASQQLLGTVYYAEVRNGIDGPIVAKFDPTNMAKTGTRTPASTVQPGGSPNLLTPNQASIETDATGWAAGTNATIAQDATQFLDGTKSLAVTAVAVGSSFASTTAGPRVAPGKLYTATAWFKAGVTGRAVQLFIDWYSDVGGYISTSAVIASGTDVSGSWTATSGSIVAPAGVGQAGVKVKINDVTQVLGEVHYVDRVSLVEAAEVWTMNGSAWDLVAA